MKLSMRMLWMRPNSSKPAQQLYNGDSLEEARKRLALINEELKILAEIGCIKLGERDEEEGKR